VAAGLTEVVVPPGPSPTGRPPTIEETVRVDGAVVDDMGPR
jgi:hypothetical protein